MTLQELVVGGLFFYAGFIATCILLSIWNHTWAWMNTRRCNTKNQVLNIFGCDCYDLVTECEICPLFWLILFPTIFTAVPVILYFAWQVVLSIGIVIALAHLGRFVIRLRAKLASHVTDKSIHVGSEDK